MNLNVIPFSKTEESILEGKIFGFYNVDSKYQNNEWVSLYYISNGKLNLLYSGANELDLHNMDKEKSLLNFLEFAKKKKLKEIYSLKGLEYLFEHFIANPLDNDIIKTRCLEMEDIVGYNGKFICLEDEIQS